MNYPVQDGLVPSFYSSLLFSVSHAPSLPPSPLPPSLSPPSLPPPGVIDSRRSSQQVLDHLPVERERGITVKAQTASMVYRWQGQQQLLLNLIDTPVGPHVFLVSWEYICVVCTCTCAMCMYSVHTCLYMCTCICTCIYMYRHVACHTLGLAAHAPKCLIES